MLPKMGEGQSQSPTQYYLSELGLNEEWQSDLLRFGPENQSGQEYINRNIRQSFDRQAMRIRTFPHIVIPATPESVLDLPVISIPSDKVSTANSHHGDGSGDSNKTDSHFVHGHECQVRCLAAESFDILMDNLRIALPREQGPPLRGPEIVQRTVEILKDYPLALKRIAELEDALNELQTTSPSHHVDVMTEETITPTGATNRANAQLRSEPQ